MTSKYRYQVYEPSMFEAVCALRADVFGGSIEDNRSYMQWKYIDNPFLDEPVIHAVFAGDDLIGMRGWYGASWSVPGIDTPMLIPAVGEIAITDDHRRTRAIIGLVGFTADDLAARGYDLGLGVSATPASVRMGLRIGWHWVANYETLVRTTKPSNLARAAGRFGRAVGMQDRSALPFDRLDAYLNSATASLSVVEPEHVLDLFADHGNAQTGVRHVRDERFYRWRFKNPLMNYRIVTPKAAEPDACLVIQFGGGNAIRIIDWAGAEERVGDLIESILQVLDPVTCQIWGAWLPTYLAAHVKKLGFRLDDKELERGLLVRSFTDNPVAFDVGSRSLLDASTWDMRMISSDRY